MYRQDFGRYPPTLEALTQPRPGGLRPFLKFRGDGQDQPRALDPWGHPLIYRYNHVDYSSPYELYSVGPNGIDESGKGDDVTSD